ncbi:MAG: GTPase [Cyanobacteria bacterium P01_F01_bin.150]
MTDFWQQTSQYLKHLNLEKLNPASFPKELSAWLARKSSRWLDVDDKQIAEILESLRGQLPTTEAILIGKPQAGKSSIVRGLTGVSADIVGQGFRPHTQNTERYAYPSAELPLLIFTDTVGLGDVAQDTESWVEELVEGWGVEELGSWGVGALGRKNEGVGWVDGRKPNTVVQTDNNSGLADVNLEGGVKEKQQARVLILTVKINDFAVASLRDIVKQVRYFQGAESMGSPAIPCLLVVTCVHELYASDVENHPDYPPMMEDVNRAFESVKEAFDGLWDRAILIDFTLEEDGYSPVFYGLEALRDTLAELLPEAEARTIRQLLDADASKQANEQLGSVYREVGRRYMLAFATMAATLAAVPLPFATMPVLTALQVSMVGLLGKLYGQKISTSQAGGIVSAIAGGFLAQAIGRELIKFIPGFGSVVAASWAAAYTWALGEGACVYFGDVMGGKKPDPDRIQQAMTEAFQAAKERFKKV